MEKLEFIQAQVTYYKKHLGSGNDADKLIIAGLLAHYEAQLKELKDKA